MRRRSTDFQIYSLSFLDIVFCALGGVLIITIQALSLANQKVLLVEYGINQLKEKDKVLDEFQGDLRKLASQVVSLRAIVAEQQKKIDAQTKLIAKQNEDLKSLRIQLARVQEERDRLREAIAKSPTAEELARLRIALDESKRTIQDLENKVKQLTLALQNREEQLKKVTKERDDLLAQIQDMKRYSNMVLGLKGPMKNVVFVFDTSGSMKVNEFGSYREQLKAWIRSLRFEKLGVVRFSTDVQSWPPSGLTDQANRAGALTFIDSFQAEGNTNTRGALEKAFGYEGVDTIILFSDGEPNLFDAKGQPLLVDPADPSKGWIKGGPAIEEVYRWLKFNSRKERPVVINTVGMGRYLNQDYGTFLQTMARDNGGRFIGLGLESVSPDEGTSKATPR